MPAAPSGAAREEVAIAIGVAAVGGVYAWGALDIPAEAGYAGVGPNFLPWVVAVSLLLCAALLLWEALSGGYRARDEPDGAALGYWRGFLWVSAALLVNAALITRIGFILSCSLCFVLAVRGLRNADLPEGAPAGFSPTGIVRDLAIGFALSAPVFWMFTKLLAINLPGLVRGGWI